MQAVSGMPLNPFLHKYTSTQAWMDGRACSICGALYVVNVQKLWG